MIQPGTKCPFCHSLARLYDGRFCGGCGSTQEAMTAKQREINDAKRRDAYPRSKDRGAYHHVGIAGRVNLNEA